MPLRLAFFTEAEDIKSKTKLTCPQGECELGDAAKARRAEETRQILSSQCSSCFCCFGQMPLWLAFFTGAEDSKSKTKLTRPEGECQLGGAAKTRRAEEAS